MLSSTFGKWHVRSQATVRASRPSLNGLNGLLLVSVRTTEAPITKVPCQQLISTSEPCCGVESLIGVEFSDVGVLSSMGYVIRSAGAGSRRSILGIVNQLQEYDCSGTGPVGVPDAVETVDDAVGSYCERGQPALACLRA